ncbi:MAG: hypothetical protein CVT75_06380 [Alphaproteobacteria bacterium HGW-Alphaproteobacteria-14]|nr:MAG: hypothetical protein CVT75_06380 [Alphaproteobacteria bacterium HGW-Alphaproteobacteria-14]
MNEARPATFSRAGALALVAVGFAVFLALIYLIAAGEEFGGNRNNGEAHAAANGLNGYAGLVRLLEADGYDVNLSRSPAGLETDGLLVLTPPAFVDAGELAELLQRREEIGPTLVILPKWSAAQPPPTLPAKARAKFKPGWVMLTGADAVDWTSELPAPYAFKHVKETLKKDEAPGWDGFGVAGEMPTRTILYAEDDPQHETLIADAAGHALAFGVMGEPGTDYYDNAHWTVFVTDADLMNNYGLADRTRATAAIALVNYVTYDRDISGVTFDMTLNGFGASENLLTLAFRPPFLAATLCLLMALLIVGWRAFLRFGPAASASGPAIAFGKQRLIANGANLILRARRLPLLAAPYATLSARRLAERLGVARRDAAAIDAALARRLPEEEPFSRRAARLEAATRPADILGAAQALDDLTTKLSHQTVSGTQTP